MLNVKIIAMGRLKENYLKEAAAEYQKRLSRFVKLSIIELNPEKLSDNPSQAEIDRALKREAQLIEAKIGSGAFVCALCIEGKQLKSEELAERIYFEAANGSGELDFIIGSSFGLADEIKARASLKLSMSRMTFPHQLARVMLLEQLYRAAQIEHGGKYHK